MCAYQFVDSEKGFLQNQTTRSKSIKRPLKAKQLMREHLFESEPGSSTLKMRNMKSCRNGYLFRRRIFLIGAAFLGK